MKVQVEGTISRPYLAIRADDDDKKAKAWLRSVSPRWDTDRRCWIVTDIGPGTPSETLGDLGVDRYTIKIEGVTDIDGLAGPAAGLSKEPGRVEMWPRLGGTSHLGWPSSGRRASRRAGQWTFPHASLLVRGELRGSVYLEPGVAEAIKSGEAEAPRRRKRTVRAERQHFAFDPDTAIVPEWFGLEIDEAQRVGAINLLSGRNICTDEMGVGKTRLCLAAAAMLKPERVVAVVPSVAAPGWDADVTAAGFANPTLWVSGRKISDLPERGTLVVTDSILAARPELVAAIVEWVPDVLLVDEAHRMKTRESRRASAVLEIANATSMVCIPLTGSPVLNDITELIVPLDISGHLNSVFGGEFKFLRTYTMKLPHGGRIPIKSKMAGLAEILNSQCWVRRTKAEVLGLPPKRRTLVDVEADSEIYPDAVDLVWEQIDSFLDLYDGPPPKRSVSEWCRKNVGAISPLRRAAGTAKIPAALEFVIGLNPTKDDPVIVWVYHTDVATGVVEGLTNAGLAVESILGGIGHGRRKRVVEGFQANQYDVLVCQIVAAGVAITLTASHRAVFVESDWVPAIQAQAEDRIHRRGQTSTCDIWVMVAGETIDRHIQKVLDRKILTLRTITPGGDFEVSVSDGEAAMTPQQLLLVMVNEEIAARWHSAAA